MSYGSCESPLEKKIERQEEGRRALVFDGTTKTRETLCSAAEKEAAVFGGGSNDGEQDTVFVDVVR